MVIMQTVVMASAHSGVGFVMITMAMVVVVMDDRDRDDDHVLMVLSGRTHHNDQHRRCTILDTTIITALSLR